VASAVGTGFDPNSSITLHVEISSPFTGSTDIPDFAMTDGNGSWSFTGTIPCDFGDGPFVGQFIEDVIATDALRRLRVGPPHGQLRLAGSPDFRVPSAVPADEGRVTSELSQSGTRPLTCSRSARPSSEDLV